MPILGDLYNELWSSRAGSARIAAALELYVSGSLNVFNHRTDVELSNRLVCFDIKQLGEAAQKLGMLIVQDHWYGTASPSTGQKGNPGILWTISSSLERGTAAYFRWNLEAFQKMGRHTPAITQERQDLLASREVENIFENSDFVLMLNQAAGDRALSLCKAAQHLPQQMKCHLGTPKRARGLSSTRNVVLPL